MLCEGRSSDTNFWSPAFLFWQTTCVTGWNDFSSLASSSPTGYRPRHLEGTKKKIHPAPWWQEDAFWHCTHSGSKVLEIGPLLNVFILSLCYSLSNTVWHNKDYQRPRKLRNGSTSLWAAVFKLHWMFSIKKMQDYDMYWENILALSYRR